MPLKHLTETVLVVLLAIVTIVTGVLVATLPPVPEGFFPWVGIFVATVLYPAVFYPLLRNNRADYAFRALHFAPVAIALGWLLLQVLVLKFPASASAERVYTWGWSVLPVAVVFVLLTAFCLQVIRRRVPRVAFLLFLLAPFVAVAYGSERYTQWDAELASFLWKQRGSEIAMEPGRSASSPVAVSSRGEKNLSASSLPEEEEWRKKLRALEEGKVHSVTASVQGTLAGVQAATGLSGGASGRYGTKHVAITPRTRLPKSGGEMEAMGLLVLAGFAATVHARARWRMQAAL